MFRHPRPSLDQLGVVTPTGTRLRTRLRAALGLPLALTWGALAGSLVLVGLAAVLDLAARREAERNIRRAMQDRVAYAAQVTAMVLTSTGVATASTLGDAIWRHPVGDAADPAFTAPESLLVRLRWVEDSVLYGTELQDSLRAAFRYDAHTRAMAWAGVPLAPALRARAEAYVRAVTDRAPAAPPPYDHVATKSLPWGRDVLAVRLLFVRTRGRIVGAEGITFSRDVNMAANMRLALAQIPLLPASLSTGAQQLGALTPAYARLQRRTVGIRVLDNTNGRVLFDSVAPLPASTVGEYGWAAPGGASYRFRISLADSLTQALIAAAPIPIPEWAIIGVLGIALLLAVAGAAGLRTSTHTLRARQQFLSAVSHELRTPLTQVRLHVDLLHRLLPIGGDDAASAPLVRASQAAQAVDRGVQQLARLVENLLVFSRAGLPRWTVYREPVDLDALVRTTLDGLGPLTAPRQATLVYDGPGPLEAVADPSAVRQVLINLVSNALKYGPAGQTVRVALCSADVDGHAMAELSVIDEGPGIPHAERERVWRPFERLHGAERRVDGVGLGLTVVRELVARHGGSVRVDDAPDGGARFIVAFPRAGDATVT